MSFACHFPVLSGRFATIFLILGSLACGVPGEARARATPAPALAPASEAFVQARSAAARGDVARFETAAARAVAPPGLKPYLDYWRLQLALADERAGAAMPDRRVQAFLRENPGTLVADLLRRDWLLNLAKRGDWKTFDAEFPAWILRDDARVFCLAGKANLLRGAAPGAEALAALERTRDLGENCLSFLTTLVNASAYGPTELRARLLLALEHNNAGTIGEVAALLGLDGAAVAGALANPEKALASPADSTLTLIALTRLARSRPQAAVPRLETIGTALGEDDRSFVWSQIAASAMRRLAPEAAAWTRRALTARASDDTWEMLARAALRAQDWPLLLATTERMTPAGRLEPTWVYWRARALRAQGQTAEADAQLRTIAGQFHFYGQLAAEDLGELTRIPARGAPPTPAELVEAGSNPGFARAMRFYELGMRPEGNREWNYQLRGMSDRQLLAAATHACAQSILDRCVNTADRTRSEHDFDLRFVSPHRDELASAASERGLDPAWVYGLIRQESRFISDARSSAGAKGMMQIMPATGRWIARKLGVTDFRVEQLDELSVNLRFGTFYLKTVLDDLEGSPVLASAAYNAGPNRPRSWRATLSGSVEGAIFAEIIPFSETRDYVKKVLSNATYYAAVFSGQPQSLRARLGSVQARPAAPTAVP